MVKISKILVNVDFTTPTLKALEYAKDLANKYSAELVVFYEMEDVYILKRASVGFGMPVPPDLEEKSRKTAQLKMQEVMKNFEGKYKPIIDCCGKMKDRLLKTIEEENPDLVVITSECQDLINKIKQNVFLIK